MTLCVQVFSPTGSLDRDIDDVRRFADAARSGIEKALSAGSKAPLLVRVPDQCFPYASLVSVFGASQALYKVRKHPKFCHAFSGYP